ncbi:uncharacterized protein LOC111026901 [Myzus persicae]|uniref:uncharacterized protein LOC111026901 n=1 Tax=Myzus persicae TaxID=13164 RepID=UPI000B93590C|nr:uncharacterized protein LOC111026901 [Myzus persicae]
MFSKNSKLSNTPSISKSDTNAVGQSNDRIDDKCNVEPDETNALVDTSMKTMSDVTDHILADKTDTSVSKVSVVPLHNNDPVNQLPVNCLELRDRKSADPYCPNMESYPKTMQGASERSLQKT